MIPPRQSEPEGTYAVSVGRTGNMALDKLPHETPSNTDKEGDREHEVCPTCGHTMNRHGDGFCEVMGCDEMHWPTPKSSDSKDANCPLCGMPLSEMRDFNAHYEEVHDTPPTDTGAEHQHEWLDANNEHIQGWEVCRCGAMRSEMTGVWIANGDNTAMVPETAQTEAQGVAGEVVDELRRIRSVYDEMELRHGTDSMEGDREFVTWRGWKMIRNVITDRIEELTGGRQ